MEIPAYYIEKITPKKVRKDAHRRDILERIHTLTGIDKKALHWKLLRIPDDWLEQALTVGNWGDSEVDKRVRFWKEINKFKFIKI